MGRLAEPKSCNYYWQIMSIMMCLIPLWLYSSMLPTLFAVSRQPQFDVLSGKASRPYDDGRVQVGDELPRPRILDKYWGYFLSMEGNASTMRFSDNQGVTHHLPCSKEGQQGDGLETIRFAVTVHPSMDVDTSIVRWWAFVMTFS